MLLLLASTSSAAENLQFIGRVQIEIALQLMIIYRRFMHSPIPISAHTKTRRLLARIYLRIPIPSLSSNILAGARRTGYCCCEVLRSCTTFQPFISPPPPPEES